MLIALVTSTQETIHDLAPLVAQLLKLPLDGKITGVLHTKNDSLADVVQSDETVILYGQDYFYEELLGLRFKISQFSFFQTNTLGAEVLYETARTSFWRYFRGGKRDKTIFDLYSGTGTIRTDLSACCQEGDWRGACGGGCLGSTAECEIKWLGEL